MLDLTYLIIPTYCFVSFYHVALIYAITFPADITAGNETVLCPPGFCGSLFYSEHSSICQNSAICFGAKFKKSAEQSE